MVSHNVLSYELHICERNNVDVGTKHSNSDNASALPHVHHSCCGFARARRIVSQRESVRASPQQHGGADAIHRRMLLDDSQ